MAAKQAAVAEKKKPIAVISPQKKEKSTRIPKNEKAAKEILVADARELARSRFYTIAVALIGTFSSLMPPYAFHPIHMKININTCPGSNYF